MAGEESPITMEEYAQVAEYCIKSRMSKRMMTAWREFQYQNHSLSVNASEVAACVGFHEYKSVPELMVGHVYQGKGGRALLKHDAVLLGLQLVSEEEQVLEIAELAGPATTTALMEALQIKRGERKVENVQIAKQMRQEVVEQAKASKKLNKHQLAMLEEKTRQSIDTGCGHSWEDEALDRYEKLCGWEVRQRNAECRVWDFEKCDTTAAPSELKGESDSNFVPSLKPVGPAVAPSYRYNTRKRKMAEAGVDVIEAPPQYSNGRENASMVALTEDKNDDEQCSNMKTSNSNATAAPFEASRFSVNQKEVMNRPRHFLSIKGMVDGIRDELTPGKTEEDDSWILHNVIVECKHRMRTMLSYPRFYECIQAVIYCQMYDAEEADIIQVLRRGNADGVDDHQVKSIIRPENKEAQYLMPVPSSPVVTEKDSIPSPERKKLLTDYFDSMPSKSNCDTSSAEIINEERQSSTRATQNTSPHAISQVATCVGVNSNAEEEKEDIGDDKASSAEKSEVSRSNPSTSMDIFVSRISLHDHFEHLRNWNTVILPRLRIWADAVYQIRQSDELRYRLLSCMNAARSPDADSSIRRVNLESAWQLVFALCPFLRDGYSFECYRKEISAEDV
jgi:hypothetical protein